jgi:serpin B
MRKSLFFVVCVVLVLASVGSSTNEVPDAETPADLKQTVEGNGAFAMELFARLKDTDGNLFLSPYSISSALAIAYGGARGNTEKQMSTTLHFLADQDTFHSAMSKLRQTFAKINAGKRIELNVANGLWTQKGYDFTPAFLGFAKEKYGAAADPVDFINDREGVRSQINLWVEHETKQKIKNALPSGGLSGNTRAVIVNAIYFKGDWANRFDASKTEQEPFWITPAESIKARMMRQNHVFRYAEQDDLQILELPYIGYDLSMLVLLPKERDGLTEMEKRLNGDNVAKWIKALGVRTVDVRFPKFKIDSRFSLRQTLSAMGMSDAFSQTLADFTGMTPKRPMFIDAVDHAAIIEVDEKGTVAAAATSVSFLGCAAPSVPPPATFHADHPFVFLIRDNHTGTILFLGRIMNPTE